MPVGVRDPERTRRRLLQAAEKDFAAHGFAGARIARIARAAGVNQRMLYHYFGSKEGIWEAVYRELTQWLLSRLVEDLKSRSQQEPLDAFAHTLRTYFDLVASRPTMSRIFMYETLRGLKTFLEVSRIVGEPSAPLVAVLAEAMQRGQETGQVRSVQDALNAFALGALFINTYPLMRGRYTPALESLGIPPEEQDRYVRESLIKVLTFGVAGSGAKR